MRKLTVIVAIFLILNGVGINSFLLASTAPQQNSKEISVKIDDTSFEDAIVVNLVPKSTEIKKLQISLPTRSEYSNELTSQINENSFEGQYNSANHSITFNLENHHPNQNISFVLTNIKDEQITLDFGILSNDDETYVEEFKFKVQQQSDGDGVNKEDDEIDTEPNTTEVETNQDDVKITKEKEELPKEKEVDQMNDNKVQSNSDENKKNDAEQKELSKDVIQDGAVLPANLEFYFKSLSEEVESGEIANFELNVKITGSQTKFTDGEIVVNLPKHEEIPVDYPQIADGLPNETLKIAGVNPAYDEAAGTLTYQFEELKSGQTYKTVIEVVPELGKTPASDKGNNKRSLEADASIKVDELDEVIQSDIESAKVLSNGGVKISKAYVQTIKDGQESNDPAVQGDYGIWRINTSIPKKSAGLTYIKENSKIKITDKLPSGLIFDENQQDSDFQGVYNPINRTITWEFDAPTFSEQETADENLFEKELNIKLLFDHSIKNYEKIKNEAAIDYQLYGDVTVKGTASAQTQIASGDGSTKPLPEGFYFPTHHGAKNGIGDRYQNSADGNGKTPTISDNAYLFFNAQAHPAIHLNDNNVSPVLPNRTPWPNNNADRYKHGYNEYKIEYQIDDKLELESIQMVKPIYNPGSQTTSTPLEKLPETHIRFKVDGNWTPEHVIDKFDTKLYMEGFDLPDGHVESYEVTYRDTIDGFFSSVQSYFNVYEGSLGRATNSVRYHIELGNGKKYLVTPRSDESSLGDRHLLIAKNPDLPPPTVRTGIQFVESGDQSLSEGSNIQRGNNRIQVEMQSDSSSQSNVNSPMELVALLPKGVNILEQPNIIFSDNSEEPEYEIIGEIDGQQQVKFTWKNRRLLPKEKLSASFDVDVTRTAPSKLEMEVFGFVGNKDVKVPTVSGDSLTNSIIQTDEDDINDNGNTTENVFVRQINIPL